MNLRSSLPDLPDSIRTGLAGLSPIDGVDILKEPIWNDVAKRWVVHCALTISSFDRDLIPGRSKWYILLENRYPYGSIAIHPSKRQGVIRTFPHQARNLNGDDRLPWRTGKICVHDGSLALGRVAGVTEPFNPSLRLRWRVLQAMQWLVAASRGELAVPGAPFELPDFGFLPDTVIGFAEDPASFELWSRIDDEFGIAELQDIKCSQPANRLTAVTRYASADSQTLYEPTWGASFVPERGKNAEVALWMRLPSVPTLSTWKAPATFGELIESVRAISSLDLMALIDGLSRVLRLQRRQILLCGFPVASHYGEPATEYFWQALQLPRLQPANGSARGFRNREDSLRRADRLLSFRPTTMLSWLRSENWHPTTRSVRGCYRTDLTQMRVLVVGVGSVGSAVAELLVRGGVKDLVLCDSDTVSIGNLSRHLALMSDVGSTKASVLARRLNLASPHVSVRTMASFPPNEHNDIDAVREADLIIDCTGEDGVLFAFSEYDWQTTRAFYSISLDWEARRCFCYYACGTSFPVEAFIADYWARIPEETSQLVSASTRREGLGCWHPIMPARIDNVWMLTAAAVRHLDDIVNDSNAQGNLVVFEQENSPNFIGVRRV